MKRIRKIKDLYVVKNGGAHKTTFDDLRANNNKVDLEEYHSNRKLAKLVHNNKINNNNFKGFGFEIEVEPVSDWCAGIDDLISNINDYYGGLFGFECDGSLDEGVEIVSRPMTGYVLDNIDFENLNKIIKSNGYGATTNTGGHIHISASLFGKTNGAVRSKLIKIFRLFENNQDFVNDISGREKRSSYSKPITYKSASVEEKNTIIDNYFKGLCFDRYTWINLLNWFNYQQDGYGINTIEFRLFGSCFDNRLKDRVYFIENLIETAGRIKLEEAHDLNKWLDHTSFFRGCFVISGRNFKLINKYIKKEVE